MGSLSSAMANGATMPTSRPICKVVYVSVMRLSARVARDWYLDYLMEKGATVEYWDVTSLLYGEDGRRSEVAEFLRVPATYAELEVLLQRPENRGARYAMLVHYESRTVRLFRIFSRHDCRMLFFSWGALPIGQVRRWRRGLSNVAATAANAAGRLKAAVYMKLGLIKKFEIVFAAGRALLSGAQHASRVVPINLVDFDHFVQVRSQPARLVADRYAVFLDIDLPHQSDLRIVGLPAIDATRYYRSLNRFFGLVEDRYGVTVVVAAHPKATYDERTFDGRTTLKGRTAELVRDAEFVISHHSTSLSYAVLNEKPLVFIYTGPMKEAYELTLVTYLYELATFLGATIYDIDELGDGSAVKVEPVSESRYREYKYEFLTSPESEGDSTGEILWRELARAGMR